MSFCLSPCLFVLSSRYAFLVLAFSADRGAGNRLGPRCLGTGGWGGGSVKTKGDSTIPRPYSYVSTAYIIWDFGVDWKGWGKEGNSANKLSEACFLLGTFPASCNEPFLFAMLYWLGSRDNQTREVNGQVVLFFLILLNAELLAFLSSSPFVPMLHVDDSGG
ncbi:hypothetical protein EJ06DRAFT_111483 [Trichodelitschia bisporula]|uniref:Secreted protein n=1 Tax=Trichodelitschia bisporula TaxID=703511 RepID=A0A6G1HR70_9PEZI|nr:hypothetical protein EJ06DRAFT_111483 [Trichodelitschia bisporula]